MVPGPRWSSAEPPYPLGLHGGQGGGQEPPRRLNVLHIHRLHGAVHVPERHREQPRGHPAPGHLEGPRVGARPPGNGLHLVGHGLPRGLPHQEPVSLGVEVGAEGAGRPAARSSSPPDCRATPTSTAIPAAGATPKALVTAPRRPTSSWTVATTTTSTWWRRRASSWSAWYAAAQLARLSKAFPAIRPPRSW